MENTITMTKRDVLNLPPVVYKERVKKRDIQEPDISMFNEEQRVVANKLWRFLTEGTGGIFLLKGYAGTGKSFVISRLVERYLMRKQCNMAISAPTNKAVRVGFDMAEYRHPNLTYATIHSLLGLKEQIDDWGNQKFVRDPKEPCKLDSYSVLMVDEVSMLSDELFLMLIPFVEQGLKLVLIGDPCQINPINKPDAMPLEEKTQREYGIEIAELTQIVRQKEGNPLIEITLQVRKNINMPTCLPIKTDAMVGDTGVLFFGQSDGDLLDEMLDKYYCSENFQQDTDFVRMIAWTNKTVDFLNSRARKYIFKDVESKIMVGERLLIDKPVIDSDSGERKIIYTTNDEVQVLSYEIKEEEIEGTKYRLKYYWTKVVCTSYITPKEAYIRIIHEESETLYNDLLSSLKQLALSKPKGSFHAKQGWESYFQLFEYMAKTKYGYAITAHKSQGSTYNTVVVFEGDMERNKKVVERNRLKYTAFSRPSRLLVVVT